MDRETKQIEIDKHTFVVKTYATAREAQALQQTYLEGAKIEVAGEQPKITDFDPGVQFKVHTAMLGQMVVSMDGEADNIAERCLDLPSSTYDELIAELDTLVSKKKS